MIKKMDKMKIEDYYIVLRKDQAKPTGTFEVTRRGTRKSVLKYCETYKTKAGEFTPEEWRKRIKQIIEENNERELLDKIKQHCKQNCLWIKTEQELEDYSIDCLAGRVYIHWKDFTK